MPLEVICEIDSVTSEVTYEVNGATGTKCTDITSILTQGKKVLKEELKNEFYSDAERPDYISNLE